MSDDAVHFTKVIDEEIEHRAGDFLYDVEQDTFANYVRFTIVRVHPSSHDIVSSA